MLDFASAAKEEMIDSIEYVLNRQRQIINMISIITFGKLRCYIFVNRLDIPGLGEKYKSDYVDASIFYKKLDDYLLLNLSYNKTNELEKVVFSIHSFYNISKSRYDELSYMNWKKNMTKVE